MLVLQEHTLVNEALSRPEEIVGFRHQQVALHFLESFHLIEMAVKPNFGGKPVIVPPQEVDLVHKGPSAPGCRRGRGWQMILDFLKNGRQFERRGDSLSFDNVLGGCHNHPGAIGD